VHLARQFSRRVRDRTVNTEKKLLAYHIGRLSDKNPEIRLRSIQELMELGDVEALSALEKVFRSDPDEAVREAARTAGREIFIRNHTRQKP
jgi:predicted transcriptional regulator